MAEPLRIIAEVVDRAVLDAGPIYGYEPHQIADDIIQRLADEGWELAPEGTAAALFALQGSTLKMAEVIVEARAVLRRHNERAGS